MARSVLVVDDDADFRALAARILTGWGHPVIAEAATIAQALQCAAERQPELVLADIGLPDGDGFDLTRELRARPNPPRVVLISSDSDQTTTSEALAAGASAFFLKEHLTSEALRRCLDGRSP